VYCLPSPSLGSFPPVTVLHCTATHCTVLPRTALYCHVLHCTATHCTVLPRTALYCHSPPRTRPRLAATLQCPGSGLHLQLLTTAPGMQLYAGGFLGGSLPDTKGGVIYPRFGGVCLETQVCGVAGKGMCVCMCLCE
jgi:hypothetical protein